jgi:hypothetical protein
MSGEEDAGGEVSLDRFFFRLFGPEDEFFLYRFSNVPVLLPDWTSDRTLLSRAPQPHDQWSHGDVRRRS